MATDCYSLFKNTYNQAIADGFTTAVATAAAQSAMDDCLRTLSAQTSPAQLITVTSGSRQVDQGPASGGALSVQDRGKDLGTAPKS